MGLEIAGLPERPHDCPHPDDAILYLDLKLPPRLRDAVRRHHDNLAQLVLTLRSAGLDETAIRGNVDALVDHYRSELVSAVQHPNWEA
jgi:hypothetical protein